MAGTGSYSPRFKQSGDIEMSAVRWMAAILAVVGAALGCGGKEVVIENEISQEEQEFMNMMQQRVQQQQQAVQQQLEAMQQNPPATNN